MADNSGGFDFASNPALIDESHRRLQPFRELLGSLHRAGVRSHDHRIGQAFFPEVAREYRLSRQVVCRYCEETLDSGDSRVVLKLPPALAPVKVAILPLVRKDGMPEKARELIDKLKFNFKCHYDEKDSIGKRYRRQDAIGTPYCVTIDHQTLEDNTVTIRERDSMEQKRVTFDELENEISKTTSIESLLRQLI